MNDPARDPNADPNRNDELRQYESANPDTMRWLDDGSVYFFFD